MKKLLLFSYDPDSPFQSLFILNISAKFSMLSVIFMSAFLSFSSNVNAQNVNIPDAVFKAALVADPNIDINGDGEIQVAEAAAFTGAINVSSLVISITNLQGIEAFTSLTQLDCSNNQLTNLDVSFNTALTTLICGNNNISSLDITKNTSLTVLSCFGNHLTILDVSHNTQLTELDCSTNAISSLDVTANTALNILHCSSNSLSSIDVTTNTAITDLDCHYNLLSTIDVTKNTLLTTLHFSDNNNITSIDLSANPLINYLNCFNNKLDAIDVSNLSRLAYLNCSQNNLSVLDVSNNPAINFMRCHTNKISDLDVSSNTVLQSLACNNNLLSSLNLKNGNNASLLNLYATNNPLLTCIQVDDVANANSYSKWGKDATASYATSCPLTPANDDCSGAVLLTVGNGFCTNPVIGTLTNATASVVVPAGCGGLPIDVWYKVVVLSGQSIIVEASPVGGAPYGNDLLLQAIQSSDNTCDGTLVQVGCDDDSGFGSMPKLAINNTSPSDNTYFLRIKPYGTNSIHPFAICAFTTAFPPPIASGENCINNTTNIDSARKYMWTPLVDAAGNIIAEIFPNGNKLGPTTYSYYINPAAVRTDINGIKYLDRNITITPAVQPESDVFVKLYYRSSELAALQLVDPMVNSNNIVVTKTTNTCTNSVNTIALGEFLSQTSNGVYGVADSFITVNVSSFSTFFLHGGLSAVLPLTLLDFTGQKQNTNIKLQWQTTNEITTSHFFVQRSANGTTFTNIGRVEARNTSGTNDYNLTDATPGDGVNFYRLQMVDIDGKTTYSSIIKIVFSGKSELRVFPNPAKNMITLSGLENKGIIKIIAPDGKLVKQLSATSNSMLIDISTLAKGFYILQYKDGRKMEQAKIVKE
ncbi:MAG: T9SS type A sorting domain-containing protein [Ginsengibacter sp.]